VLTNANAILNAGSFINAGGSVDVTAGGLVDGIGGLYGSFVQSAGTTTVNGTMVQDTVRIESGVLKGSGTVTSLSAPLYAGPGATIQMGNSPGTLHFGSDFFCNSCVLEVEVGGLGAGQFDILDVAGQATFAGGSLINFSFIDSFLPGNGDSFEFLAAYSIEGLDQITFSFTGLAAGFDFQVNTAGGSLSFLARSDGAPPSQVPAPGTAVLMALGLGPLMFALARRRTSASGNRR